MTYEELELPLLRELEKEIRAMFEFTGWGDDVDEDAAETAHRVETLLGVMGRLKELMPRQPSPQEPK